MSPASSSAAAAAKSGSRLVVGIVGLTVAALGIGTVYLPFVADRDKIRGMNEESGASAVERFEYERAMREMSMAGGGPGGLGEDHPQRQDAGGNAASASPPSQQQQKQPAFSNNMWERMKQAARSPSERPGKD